TGLCRTGHREGEPQRVDAEARAAVPAACHPGRGEARPGAEVWHGGLLLTELVVALRQLPGGAPRNLSGASMRRHWTMVSGDTPARAGRQCEGLCAYRQDRLSFGTTGGLACRAVLVLLP